ncbi:MAG TPA: TadE family protein [Chloroflexota bacterium]
MVEFALIAPILFLIIFGVVDFGRGMYYYITLSQASNEGARVAVRASYYTDISGTQHQWPNDDDVTAAVAAHAPAVFLANPCANGPINTAQVPPPNEGWVYITANTPDGSGTPNAPAGGAGTYVPNGVGCIYPPVPAANNAELKVTVRYNFVPLTPLIQQVTANRIILTAWSVYRTEY